jgi:hypothetical protein
MSAATTIGTTIALVALAAACLGIMVSAICRLNILTPKVSRRGWMLMYLAFGGFAIGELIAAVQARSLPSEWELMGLLGVGMNLLLTHRHWRDGAPQATKKERMT